MSRQIPVLIYALAGACLAGGLLYLRSESPATAHSSIPAERPVLTNTFPSAQPASQPLIADLPKPDLESTPDLDATVPSGPPSRGRATDNDFHAANITTFPPPADSHRELAPDSPIPLVASGNLEIEVPPGAPLPISLIPALSSDTVATELTPAQQRVAERIAEEFVQQIAATDYAASPSTEANPERLRRWQSAVAGADERLRWLLGQDSYNREIIRQTLINQKTPTTN